MHLELRTKGAFGPGREFNLTGTIRVLGATQVHIKTQADFGPEMNYSIMQTGQAKFGMQTLNQSLYELFVRKNISYDDCVGRSSNADELIQMLGRSGLASAQTTPKDYR